MSLPLKVGTCTTRPIHCRAVRRQTFLPAHAGGGDVADLSTANTINRRFIGIVDHDTIIPRIKKTKLTQIVARVLGSRRASL